jgi:hypothetical protein
MNRVPNGDVFLQPLNMTEAGAPPPIKPQPSEPSKPPVASLDGAKALLHMAAELVARAEAEAAAIPLVWPARGHVNGTGAAENPDN